MSKFHNPLRRKLQGNQKLCKMPKFRFPHIDYAGLWVAQQVKHSQKFLS